MYSLLSRSHFAQNRSFHETFNVGIYEGLEMDIGFIGIGSMGAAMVPNLVKAGHRVSVWNRTLAATKALEGVTILPSIASAFQRDAVVTMLWPQRLS
jgi:phosphoglycerate dehydrogenase-like enzyme